MDAVGSHAQRLARAQAAVARRGAAALLVGPSADLRYLVGHHAPALERLTLLVVPAHGHPRLVVPALEAPLARESLSRESLDEDVELCSWQETDDPYGLVTDVMRSNAEAGREVLVADRLWASVVLRLQHSLPRSTWGSASPVLAELRLRKDEAEVQALRAVGAAIDTVTASLPARAWIGRSEQELAAELDRAIRDAGHEETCFVIVGSGPNSASPHHVPGSRRLQARDVVVVDIGGRRGGYCSDTTRTIVLGEPPQGFTELYEVLEQAQQAGVDAVKPGVPAETIDAACREPIEAAGFGEAFIHRTGHGIGLDEHEDPYLVGGNREVLDVGMAFSIEPGIYLPGRYGARIEDIVVVTHQGAERLNTTSRQLQVISD